MASTTTDRPAQTPAPEPGPRDPQTGRLRPVGGMELWMWLFMRISGLLLLFLAIGHVLIMHIPDGGVSRVDFAFVQVRWSSLFWRTWDWMLLMLALVHGVNGLRNITLDYVRRPGVRLAITTSFWVLGFALMVLGTIVVVTFDPAKWPPVS
jgi:succinate dehydrogenase / fumarate reductase, membrane anchor subunit